MLRQFACYSLIVSSVGLSAGCSSRVSTAEVDVRHYAHPGDADALAELIAYSSRELTKLPPDYLLNRLASRAEVPSIATAFDQLMTRSTRSTRAARAELIGAIELDFVHSAQTSSLDLLGAELSERFRTFDWTEDDYPGGAEGPNEMYAGTLADALDSVTPERRANRSDVAVIVREQATDEIWEYMLAQWREVPDEDEKKLNQYAMTAYVEMRDAAAADGVDLTILSGHRDPERARASAERAGNSFAVASFSSHSLGLAVDFLLPRPDGEKAQDDDEAAERFRLTTRPMSGVVDMRQSPVHKWLHLYGREYGWYPFQHEPWHWEFNPPGFRDVFFTDLPAGPPQRPATQPVNAAQARR